MKILILDGNPDATHDHFDQYLQNLTESLTSNNHPILMLQKPGLTNFYWNSQLKKNGAHEQRFIRPFE